VRKKKKTDEAEARGGAKAAGARKNGGRGQREGGCEAPGNEVEAGAKEKD